MTRKLFLSTFFAPLLAIGKTPQSTETKYDKLLVGYLNWYLKTGKYGTNFKDYYRIDIEHPPNDPMSEFNFKALKDNNIIYSLLPNHTGRHELYFILWENPKSNIILGSDLVYNDYPNIGKKYARSVKEFLDEMSRLNWISYE